VAVERAIQPLQQLTGTIYEIKDDRRFGFIRSDDDLEFFFHLTDLTNITWEEIDIGMEIEFAVVKPPSLDRAGKAANIRAIFDDEEWIDEDECDEADEAADEDDNDEDDGSGYHEL
jgi:cold shock CspA family protein